MCGDLARVVVKMLNARRCAWPWRERIVTMEDIRDIMGRLAVDENEVTQWLKDRRQWVAIMDALTEDGRWARPNSGGPAWPGSRTAPGARTRSRAAGACRSTCGSPAR